MTAPSTKEALEDLISLCERNLYPQPDKPNSDWMRVQAAKVALATLQPDGERREAIARALAEKWPGDYMQGDDECEREPNALAYETADLILASDLAQDEVLIALKRELEECKNAVATIEANRNPNSETQNGNYRFYQGRVVSLQFAIKVIEGK